MRHLLLLIFYITIHFSAYGINDSILFSTDGQYILVKEEGCCSYDYRVLYHTNNKERSYYVLTADSAYELTFNGNDPTKRFPVINGSPTYLIKNSHSYQDFIEKYKLKLKSFMVQVQILVKADTLKQFKQALNAPCHEDTSTYYQIRLQWINEQRLLTTDTLTSNVQNKNFYHEISEYRLYYSADSSFYLLYGDYSYSEMVCPNSYSLYTKHIRHIGKNEH